MTKEVINVMSISNRDKQAFTDLSIIIKMMPQNMRQKISTTFINFIEEHKDTNYISQINPNIPIREQKLSETTKTLLALIYIDYLCSKEERKKLILAENEELQKIENENRIKYEIDFEKRNKNSQIQDTCTDLIEYKKETFLMKIINKLKKIFNLK